MQLLHQKILYVSGRVILEGMQEWIIATDDKIRDEKLQDDINEKEAKISALSSLKKWQLSISYKWRNITFLSKTNNQITKQAKFTYSPLGKGLEKQKKKQVYALKPLVFPNKTDCLNPGEWFNHS